MIHSHLSYCQYEVNQEMMKTTGLRGPSSWNKVPIFTYCYPNMNPGPLIIQEILTVGHVLPNFYSYSINAHPLIF